MNRFLKLTLLFLCLQAIAFQGASAKTRVVSPQLGIGLQTSEGEGFYPRLAREILKNESDKYTYSVLPLKRVLVELTTGNADCIFGMDRNFLGSFGIDTSQYLESDQVLLSRQYVFTRQADTVISDLDALKNKSVAILNGSNQESTLEQLGARAVSVNSQEAKLQMLALERVEAVIGWMPDLYLTADEFGIERPAFDPNAPLATSRVTFLCKNNIQGRNLIHSANSAIMRMKKDKEAQGIQDIGWKLF
jgi:ABC-type amino acid transport substrate-binding protein